MASGDLLHLWQLVFGNRCLLLVRLPCLQSILVLLQELKLWHQLAFFQWHHHIRFGWPLPLHQALNGSFTQRYLENLWVIKSSFLGLCPLGALVTFFIDSLLWLVFTSSSGPQLVPLGNEVLEACVVGKRSILAHLATNDLVELLACRSQLQPLAATMLLNQIGRHWDCFAIIAANGCGCLDVNLHVHPWAK